MSVRTARLSGSEWASNGIQVIQGGSVGQMAKAPIVNSDGTVTVNVVKDPADSDQGHRRHRRKQITDRDVRRRRHSPYSLQGNINAGSGSKNERAQFAVDVPEVDSQGRPVIDPITGVSELMRTVYEVPGSGIFTFHPTIPAIGVSDVQRSTNQRVAGSRSTGSLGHDVSHLVARANQLKAEREPEFDQTPLIPSSIS